MPTDRGFNGAGGLPPVVTANASPTFTAVVLQWSRRFTSGCDDGGGGMTNITMLQWSRRFTSGCDQRDGRSTLRQMCFNGAGGLPPVVTDSKGLSTKNTTLQWSRRFTSGCDIESRRTL